MISPTCPITGKPRSPETIAELTAVDAMLTAHPRWGKRGVSIDDCMKCRTIDRQLKLNYLNVTRSLTPEAIDTYRKMI